jgi:hypothetical protein
MGNENNKTRSQQRAVILRMTSNLLAMPFRNFKLCS